MNIKKPGAAPVAVGVLVAMALGLAGCKSISGHLPWRHKAPPPPELSTALTVTSAEGAPLALPQYWQRNDVVLDLSIAPPSGVATVMPRAGLAWPVRIAVRVTPGAIGGLDVRGAQRVIVSVPASGKGPVDLELPVGVYVAATKQITLTWGPASVPPGT